VVGETSNDSMVGGVVSGSPVVGLVSVESVVVVPVVLAVVDEALSVVLVVAVVGPDAVSVPDVSLSPSVSPVGASGEKHPAIAHRPMLAPQPNPAVSAREEVMTHGPRPASDVSNDRCAAWSALFLV
jgi:hypothetical protein